MKRDITNNLTFGVMMLPLIALTVIPLIALMVTSAPAQPEPDPQPIPGMTLAQAQKVFDDYLETRGERQARRQGARAQARAALDASPSPSERGALLHRLVKLGRGWDPAPTDKRAQFLEALQVLTRELNWSRGLLWELGVNEEDLDEAGL